MFRLALSTLRFRKGGFVASFIVLFFGTAIVMACGGLMETGIRTTVFRAGKTLVPLSAVFGGLAVMVAMFVVASTLGLSIQLRQREMALLRAIGTTSAQLRLLVLGEALVVSALAAVVGYFPGSHLGEWLLGQIVGSGAVRDGVTYHQGWIPTVTAMGATLLTALAAAFIASRRAATARPTDALAEANLQQRWVSGLRITFALLCLAGATALAVVTALVMPADVASSTAGPDAMLWASGLALLAPGLTRMLTAVIRWPLRGLFGSAGYLAMQNSSARYVRLAGSVTPVMLATGLATALLYIQAAQGDDLTGAWVNYLLVGTLVLYTGVSLLNTLVIATTERRREFALQRLIGSTGGEVLRMMLVEGVLVAIVGCVLGSVVALATLIPFDIALDGSPWPHGTAALYLTVIGAAGAVTVVTALVSAAFALRTPPVTASTEP
jgi:predicted lysophospholipase L1 biosynthesis ABC-type transport system permease subunit